MNELTPELRSHIAVLHQNTSRLRYAEVFDPKGVKNPLLSKKDNSYLNMDVLRAVLLDDESFNDKLQRQSSAFMKTMKRVLAENKHV